MLFSENISLFDQGSRT